MGLPVSETSSKETCEEGDVVKVRVLKPTVSGDSVSPHQILHTEIFESLIIWETGHSALQDTLRGGIWLMAIPGPIPRAGRPPPDIGIGRGMMRVANVRRIISGDVIKVANIVGGARRHALMLVSDGR